MSSPSSESRSFKLSEDWLAVVIGLFVFLLSLSTLLGGNVFAGVTTKV